MEWLGSVAAMIQFRVELKLLILRDMQEEDENESDEEDDDDEDDDEEEGIEDMIAMDQGNHITIVELNEDGTEKADSDVWGSSYSNAFALWWWHRRVQKILAEQDTCHHEVSCLPKQYLMLPEVNGGAHKGTM